MTRKDLKFQAKDAIQGHWLLCVLSLLLLTALLVGCGFLPGALLIFGGPLLYGGASLFLGRMRREDVKLSNLFDGFRRFPRTFAAGLLVLFFVLLWAAVGVIPGVLFCAASTVQEPREVIRLTGICLCAAGVYLAVFKALQYSQTFYLLRDDPELGALDALQQSKVLMQGHKVELLTLYLSFFPWYLTALFTAGMSLLFIGPYVTLTCAGYYDLLRQAPAGERVFRSEKGPSDL